jgi:hypothetical protein
MEARLVDVDDILKLVAQLGLATVLVLALWYVVLVPRKSPSGKRRSSFLVPGWIHDDALAETDRVRRYYEVMLKDEQQRANVRITEWRGFRDEAVAKATDAEEDRRRLLEAVNGLSRDVALLLEIQRLAEGDRGRQGDSGDAVRK